LPAYGTVFLHEAPSYHAQRGSSTPRLFRCITRASEYSIAGFRRQ